MDQMGILERTRVLSSERCARDYYKRLRWRGKKKCPECKGVRLFFLSDKRYECEACGRRFSDFAGTYLSGIKLDFCRVAWLVQLFTLELSVRRSARELGMNYRTVYRFFDRIRRAIAADDCESWLSGEVEMDETYVGGKRKGKRGRGAAGKVPVFGMLERAGMVRVEVVPNVKEETLMALVTQHVEPGSLTYSDGFSSYSSLIINGYEHIRIDHQERFANGKAHINSIESFWAYAKDEVPPSGKD